MENQKTYSPGGMGCLVALAERCVSEGQMNLNKLLEAVVYAETRCAGWRYRPEVTRETMQQELADAIRQITERPSGTRAHRRAQSGPGGLGSEPRLRPAG